MFLLMDNQSTTKESDYIRMKDVLTMLQCGRATIYRWQASGRFPPATKLGPRLIVWPRETIENWIAAQPTQ